MLTSTFVQFRQNRSVSSAFKRIRLKSDAFVKFRTFLSYIGPVAPDFKHFRTALFDFRHVCPNKGGFIRFWPVLSDCGHVRPVSGGFVFGQIRLISDVSVYR